MDERSSRRVVSDRPVTCHFSDRAAIMKLYDLSVDGCMIATLGNELLAGDPLRIEFEHDIGADGVVVWQNSGCAGIRFVQPLHPVIVQYLGFKQPAEAFAHKPPRDNFGRLLPNLQPLQPQSVSSQSESL